MQLELNDILAIMDKVKSTGLELFEYENGEEKIQLRNAAPQKTEKNLALAEAKEEASERKIIRTETSETSEASEEFLTIESPMVGTFYVSPSAGETPFVQVGDQIKKGQVIGIVEAMKLMNEIEAEWDGTVEEILAENEQLVEFGQPLVRIRPSGK
jgi:acetyl-CoA carboxylase biotin carboxyl carrier protein